MGYICLQKFSFGENFSASCLRLHCGQDNEMKSLKFTQEGQEWSKLRKDATLGLTIGCLTWIKRCHFHALYCLDKSCDQVTISCFTLHDTGEKKAIVKVLQVFLQFYGEMFLLNQSRTSPDLTFWNSYKVCPRQPLEREQGLFWGATVTFTWEASASRLWQFSFFFCESWNIEILDFWPSCKNHENPNIVFQVFVCLFVFSLYHVKSREVSLSLVCPLDWPLY